MPIRSDRFFNSRPELRERQLDEKDGHDEEGEATEHHLVPLGEPRVLGLDLLGVLGRNEQEVGDDHDAPPFIEAVTARRTTSGSGMRPRMSIDAWATTSAVTSASRPEAAARAAATSASAS